MMTRTTTSSTTGPAARRRTSSPYLRTAPRQTPRRKAHTVSTPSDDPVVKELREQISDNDLAIIDLINKRLTLVDKLWRYKTEHGLEMYVPAREEWMVTFLSRANKGPLSQDALREVYRTIVETTKSEATRLGAG
jgi:chorismate mutase